MPHDHDHDHDCGHDHDHDGDCQEATLDDIVSHLVLSFCQLAFTQVDFEEVDGDPQREQKLLLFVYGAIHAFIESEDLQPPQVHFITHRVLGNLFPWDEAEVEACANKLFESASKPQSLEIISEGKQAMESALMVTSRLGDILAE